MYGIQSKLQFILEVFFLIIHLIRKVNPLNTVYFPYARVDGKILTRPAELLYSYGWLPLSEYATGTAAIVLLNRAPYYLELKSV